MKRSLVRSVLPVACSLLLASVAAAGGHPTLLIEMPAGTTGRAAKDAVLVVTAMHCGMPLRDEIVARAEGVVGGERRTIPLELRSTAKEATYAVPRQWPEEGRWVLTFSVASRGDVVSATVVVPPAGATGDQAVPRVTVRNEPLRAEDVEALLAADHHRS